MIPFWKMAKGISISERQEPNPAQISLDQDRIETDKWNALIWVHLYFINGLPNGLILLYVECRGNPSETKSFSTCLNLLPWKYKNTTEACTCFQRNSQQKESAFVALSHWPGWHDRYFAKPGYLLDVFECGVECLQYAGFCQWGGFILWIMP